MKLSDEHKKQRNAVLNCVFAAKMLETNLPDTKNTVFYNSKLDKEVQRSMQKFENQIIKRADGSRLELFHTMNSIATLVSRITSKDFNNLNIIYHMLAALDRGEVEIDPSEGLEPSEGLKITSSK